MRIENRNVYNHGNVDIKVQQHDMNDPSIVSSLPDNQDVSVISSDLNSTSIDFLLDTLGMIDTPQNRAMLQFLLIQDMPLSSSVVDLFTQGKYHISNRLQTMLEMANQMGLSHLGREVEQALPHVSQLLPFLLDLESSLKKIWGKSKEFYKAINQMRPNNSSTDDLIDEIFKWMFMQADKPLPFYYMQIPVKEGERFIHSELWADRKAQQVFIQFELSSLGQIGCWIMEWKDNCSINIYCRPSVEGKITGALHILKEKLNIFLDIIPVIKVIPEAEQGLEKFISRYPINIKSMDIRV